MHHLCSQSAASSYSCHSSLKIITYQPFTHCWLLIKLVLPFCSTPSNFYCFLCSSMTSCHDHDRERLCSSLILQIHSLHFHVTGSNFWNICEFWFFLWLLLSIKDVCHKNLSRIGLQERCYTKKFRCVAIYSPRKELIELPKEQITAASCHACISCQYIMKHRPNSYAFRHTKTCQSNILSIKKHFFPPFLFSSNWLTSKKHLMVKYLEILTMYQSFFNSTRFRSLQLAYILYVYPLPLMPVTNVFYSLKQKNSSLTECNSKHNGGFTQARFHTQMPACIFISKLTLWKVKILRF